MRRTLLTCRQAWLLRVLRAACSPSAALTVNGMSSLQTVCALDIRKLSTCNAMPHVLVHLGTSAPPSVAVRHVKAVLLLALGCGAV